MRTALVLPLALLVLSACVTKKEAAGTDAGPAASSAPSASSARTSAMEPTVIAAPPDVADPPPDAQKASDGLAWKVLTAGTGKDHPGPFDRVVVHYTGWTKDGRMFDSSVARHQAATFPVNGVISGWTEALQKMVVGDKWRVWIPAKLAYGDMPRMGMPAGQLTFEIELVDFKKSPPPPPVPPDVKAPPPNAKKTADGLAYRLLKAGTGKVSPTPNDVVTVNYTGWTTEGKMFDSSVVRGEPAHFPVTAVIKGWTEGLQLMKVGDQMRFWIPASLAYGDKPTRPGAPAGMLVFDVELLAIHPRMPVIR